MGGHATPRAGERELAPPWKAWGYSPAQDPSWGAACGQSEVGEPPEGECDDHRLLLA